MASGDPLNALLLTLASQAGPSDYTAGSITDENSQPGVISDEEGEVDGIDGIPAAVIDPELEGGPPPVLPAQHPARPIAGLYRQLKQRKNLSPESEAELDVFSKSNSIEDHMVLLFALTLENRDLLKSMRPEKGWTVSDKLADNIRTYATAFLLSPTLTSYRGNVANKLLDALRELNVAYLPPEKESAQVKLVLACISKYLTTAHNNIKTQLKQSIDEEEEKGNVAALAHSIIGRTGVKPTVQLYMRLAFLRWNISNYGTLEGEKWWLQVDENLFKFRTEFTTELALSAAFTNTYNNDKTRFGDPAKSTYKAAEVKSLDSWQKVLLAHARNVQPPNFKKRKAPPA